MTVKQLIEKLSIIEDQEAWVMVRGYEGGYDDVENLNTKPIDMVLDVNDEWYYGKHERIEDVVEEARKDSQIVKAIII